MFKPPQNAIHPAGDNPHVIGSVESPVNDNAEVGNQLPQ